MFDSKTILSDAVDRASMASVIYPTESRAEAALKRGLAKGLAYAAKLLDPEILIVPERTMQSASTTPK